MIFFTFILILLKPQFINGLLPSPFSSHTLVSLLFTLLMLPLLPP